MKEDYKNKTEKELKMLLVDRRNLLRDFRFKISNGKTKNVKEGKTFRLDIARILTEINLRKNKNDAS